MCAGVELPADLTQAITRAGRLHDIGKAHDVFQDTMRRAAVKRSWEKYEQHAPLAKSQGSTRHNTKNFRHELASALALLGEARPAIADLPEPLQLLCVYVIAAHHGRIRATLRSVPGEPAGVVFGIRDGDSLPSVTIAGSVVPSAGLSPSSFSGLGIAHDGTKPWQELADGLLTLHGPFKLAFLESLVRLADWHASSAPSQGVD